MQRFPFTPKHCEKLSDYKLPYASLMACTCMRFEAGETLIREDMPLHYLYIVLSGRAKVCTATPNGRHLVMCYYVSNGILGDVELMADTAVATATVIAITDFECIAIPLENNRHVLKNHTAFLNMIGKELASKLITSSRNFTSAALCSGEERLCSYILQSSHNEVFHDILTDTACSLGMSYRHMLRLFQQLCREQVLKKEAYGYRILDKAALIRRSAKEAPFKDSFPPAP